LRKRRFMRQRSTKRPFPIMQLSCPTVLSLLTELRPHAMLSTTLWSICSVCVLCMPSPCLLHMSGTKGINLWLTAQTELIKQQTKDDRDGLRDILCSWFSERIVFHNGILKYKFSCKGLGFKHMPTTWEMSGSETLFLLTYFYASRKTELWSL
jgi:hypothetical protein